MEPLTLGSDFYVIENFDTDPLQVRQGGLHAHHLGAVRDPGFLVGVERYVLELVSTRWVSNVMEPLTLVQE